MPSRKFTGGGSKVPSKRTMVRKGLAKKPSHPGGNPGSIQGVMMLKQRKPR